MNPSDPQLRLVPVTLRQARRFVGEHHRHNLPPAGWKFGVGVARSDGELCGVAIAGQPVARGLDDGWTIEITRNCTVGDRNAPSMLYGALLRAAKALGYRRAYTYTLAEEPGTSPRAVGFLVDAELPARDGWDMPARRRVDVDLFGVSRTAHDKAKVRWRYDLAPHAAATAALLGDTDRRGPDAG